MPTNNFLQQFVPQPTQNRGLTHLDNALDTIQQRRAAQAAAEEQKRQLEAQQGRMREIAIHADQTRLAQEQLQQTGANSRNQADLDFKSKEARRREAGEWLGKKNTPEFLNSSAAHQSEVAGFYGATLPQQQAPSTPPPVVESASFTPQDPDSKDIDSPMLAQGQNVSSQQSMDTTSTEQPHASEVSPFAAERDARLQSVKTATEGVFNEAGQTNKYTAIREKAAKEKLPRLLQVYDPPKALEEAGRLGDKAAADALAADRAAAAAAKKKGGGGKGGDPYKDHTVLRAIVTRKDSEFQVPKVMASLAASERIGELLSTPKYDQSGNVEPAYIESIDRAMKELKVQTTGLAENSNEVAERTKLYGIANALEEQISKLAGGGGATPERIAGIKKVVAGQRAAATATLQRRDQAVEAEVSTASTMIPGLQGYVGKMGITPQRAVQAEQRSANLPGAFAAAQGGGAGAQKVDAQLAAKKARLEELRRKAGK